jgi:hypothetical protein
MHSVMSASLALGAQVTTMLCAPTAPAPPGTDPDVVTWPDDRSRTAESPHRCHRHVHAADRHRPPASTPTDNGVFYTTRFARGGNERNDSAITVRYAGRLRHLGIGRAHRGTPVTVLLNGPDTLVTTRNTGEILAEHTIDPARDYQPRKRQMPLPKEGLHVNDDPRHP